MATHSINIRIKDRELRATLEELIAEQISDEFGIDIYSVNGMRKTIKADAADLYPRFLKDVLREMSNVAEDNMMDVLDNMAGYRGAWKPLDKLIDKYGRDTILSAMIDDQESERKIKQLKEDAAELGFEVVDLLA